MVKVLVAGFYTPAIMGIQILLGMGIRPEQIKLLTHEHERNKSLIDFAALQKIETVSHPVKGREALEWVRAWSPDVVFSLYFRDIIPAAILDIPRCGAINLHPALLPRYRGALSSPNVLIQGERETGFTYHYMVPQVDAGNIVLQETLPVRPDDTAYSLYHRLIVAGMARFEDVFERVVVQGDPGRPQEGAESYFSRALPSGGRIDPAWSREEVSRFIRAMYFPPFRGAVLVLDGNEYEVDSLEEYDRLLAAKAAPRHGTASE